MASSSSSLLVQSSSSSPTLPLHHSKTITTQLKLFPLKSPFYPQSSSSTASLPPQARRRLRQLSLKSTLAESPSLESPPPAPLFPELKLKLLSAVSGLNKGLTATEEDMQKVDTAAKELEDAGGLVDLTTDLDKLQGRWKLTYSSAFSSRTLGGSRPGPPTGRLLPITLGQVFQRIDIFSKDFDNIVELQLGAPWPFPPIEVSASLAHKFELIGSAKIRIVFEKTTVKTTGNLSQLPAFELPKIPDAFRPTFNTGSGEFEVTYLDADTRITRGDRGELRVFVIS